MKIDTASIIPISVEIEGKVYPLAEKTGNIATAAALSRPMPVSLPNLQQDIAAATEQNKTPVYLDGYKIAEIQGYNNSSTLAWNNTRAAKGVGGR